MDSCGDASRSAALGGFEVLGDHENVALRLLIAL
jgi:hypothetical protein